MLQYPLRPSLVGRDDHLLDSHLEGVRVKPKQCKLEVDLGLDPQSDTYDFTIARDHPFDLALAHGVGPPSMAVRRSGFVRAEGGRPSVFTTAATSASSDTGTCSKTLQCVSFRHSWGTLTRQAEKAAPSLSLCRSDGGQLRRATVCAHTYPTNRYDRNAEPHVRTKKQTLRSVPVPTRASLALGLAVIGGLCAATATQVSPQPCSHPDMKVHFITGEPCPTHLQGVRITLTCHVRACHDHGGCHL